MDVFTSFEVEVEVEVEVVVVFANGSGGGSKGKVSQVSLQQLYASRLLFSEATLTALALAAFATA
jgi:hypothetical protein